AGIHDSFVNIKGTESLIDHIKRVWSSLWSDRALMYTKELNHDFTDDAMAVLVQVFINGDTSGVGFSVNPMNGTELVIEAVTGTNQSFVDGQKVPERWIADKLTKKVKTVNHQLHNHREIVLNKNTVETIMTTVEKIERIFKKPQDVEWTIHDRDLYILQSRPITATHQPKLSQRALFDLGLKRNLNDLRFLKRKIQQEHIPRILADAHTFEKKKLEHLEDSDLAAEIKHREYILKKWNTIYWQDFIPFGHGMRMFADVYNRLVKPDDPYEFIQLLRTEKTISEKRNASLARIAHFIQSQRKKYASKTIRDILSQKKTKKLITQFLARFGFLSPELYNHKNLSAILIKLVRIKRMPVKRVSPRVRELEKIYFSSFKSSQKKLGHELLELGRISYRMRDDDNVYLSSIEYAFAKAVTVARRRIKKYKSKNKPSHSFKKLIHSLPSDTKSLKNTPRTDTSIKAKQLFGQPAGQGLTTGKARVVHTVRDLTFFQENEILVCDSTGPEMTYVIPYAKGIVERRGGMLIHSAIIAREYGIPCVTGVPGATQLIKTGDIVTIDGHLGIVTIQRKAP
ncbi:MAG: hypothetical protein GF384_03100, partial [Elusimicrobia bacterium]|nr:hypothetical protein [Elusimicrobiota bacterium]MBD3411921.1 hypothetical protein [Elusimicrobiota bacterium]